MESRESISQLRVTGFGAQPGLWGNRFSFLLMLEGGRTIGDVPLLPSARFR